MAETDSVSNCGGNAHSLDTMSYMRIAVALSIASRSLGPDLSRQMNESAYTHRASTPPRYVLDRLPVSYEPSFNF